MSRAWTRDPEPRQPAGGWRDADGVEHLATAGPLVAGYVAQCTCGWHEYPVGPLVGQAASAKRLAEQHVERVTGHYVPAEVLV